MDGVIAANKEESFHSGSESRVLYRTSPIHEAGVVILDLETKEVVNCFRRARRALAQKKAHMR